MIARKFRVTEKLKKELYHCSPTMYMEKILKLKILTLKKISEVNDYRNFKYKIEFLEVEKGSWLYTEKFYDELIKNKINGLSLE